MGVGIVVGEFSPFLELLKMMDSAKICFDKSVASFQLLMCSSGF